MRNYVSSHLGISNIMSVHALDTLPYHDKYREFSSVAFLCLFHKSFQFLQHVLVFISHIVAPKQKDGSKKNYEYLNVCGKLSLCLNKSL